MRCLAAVSQALQSELNAWPLHRVEVDGVAATIALLPLPEPDFDAGCNQHQDAVLVRVTAFSLNYREKYRVLSLTETQDKTYRVLGSEFVGIVEAVGHCVQHLKVGDRVIGDGCVDPGLDAPGLSSTRASAELQILPAHKVVRISSEMPDEVAAGFSVGAQTAYSMVNRLPLQPGQHVLVTGATSNTSLFVLKKLQMLGVKIHALTTNPGSIAPLRAMQLNGVCLIDKEQDFAEQFQAYLFEQGCAYLDHVVDPFFDVYLPKVLPFVRRFGFYVTCGVARQSALAKLHSYSSAGLSIDQIFNLLLRKSITLIGNNLGTAADLSQALQDYENETLRVDIAQIFEHDTQLGDFVQSSFCHTQRFGKVIFKYQ
ncbi:quinone oxidoreductase family protein [Rheinheimera sp. NSM]|uniref:quinone oxidoreductase family protein n=1 Tax=Rheinheimera sp. NSM TaxID=3457884 RepID=UPI0040375185